ncbi:MAG TPA: TlpA disulfide reductase family protein [Bacteroidales bacterium]|nr:TlpA disulfide reductase family protein [Bacteroidales bacterium]
MKGLGFYFIVLMFFTFTAMNGQSQKVERIEIPRLEKILNNPDDRLYVVNFWATWCPPCVKEFPSFQKVSAEYDITKVKFIMVSLDFPSQIKTQLIPFLKKNNVSLYVTIMTDLDYNSWIEKVDPDWQGDIPATLVFNNAKKIRKFHPGELDEPGLRKLIDSNL